MKRITQKFLEQDTKTLNIELESLKRLKIHLIEIDRKTKQNRYSAKINTIENQISKINDKLNNRNELK
jgi:hypothetical protein